MNLKITRPTVYKLKVKSEVQKILCAVTASQEAIDAAIAQNADLLLVHHGYFWKGEALPNYRHAR